MSFTNQKMSEIFQEISEHVKNCRFIDMTTIVQIILFFSIVLAHLAIAEEQTVSVDAEVSESNGLFHWLYSESTKTTIVGTVMTLITVLLGIGGYYLLKFLY